MGDELLGNEQIVSWKQDFGHDVAVVAIVFERVIGAQDVKTIGSGPVVMERVSGITGDDLVAVPDKFKTYITAEFDDVPVFNKNEVR